MNNFDIDTNSVNDLMKWIRKPRIYGLIIFDVLIILLIVHWSYGYIRYIGLILLLMFVNKLYNNPLEIPKIVRQYFGMEEKQ